MTQQEIQERNKETLEEAAEKLFSDSYIQRKIFIAGAKWQAERMYSEEELEVAFFEGRENTLSFNEWFEQFKKK